MKKAKSIPNSQKYSTGVTTVEHIARTPIPRNHQQRLRQLRATTSFNARYEYRVECRGAKVTLIATSKASGTVYAREDIGELIDLALHGLAYHGYQRQRLGNKMSGKI